MSKISRRVIYEFLLVATALCGIGYLINDGITSQLNSSLEENVLRHINTVSYSIETALNRELRAMHVKAEMFEHGRISLDVLNDWSYSTGRSGHISGMIKSDGTVISTKGGNFTGENFSLIQNAFYGSDVVCYKGGVGLILAIPSYINGETYACYQVYNDQSLKEFFGIISYDGIGRINIANKNGEWVEITNSSNAHLYDKLYQTPGFGEEFKEKISDKLLDNDRAVAQFSYNGEDFVGFGAKIYNENYLFGMVTGDAISAGAGYIHMAMLGGMVAMLVIFVMYTRTSIKSAENEELKLANAAALQASKTKSEFLSNMSHEIRTPINAVIGMNEMILRESHDENILEYAENVRIAGNNLLGIVNDILDFSKIEAGKMEIIPVEYQLSSMMNDLVNMIQKRAEKKNLQLIVNVDKNLPTGLFGDEIRIKQVVVNILTNAVKYTEKGSITLNVDSIEKNADKIKMKFSVRDTGIGIKPEDIKKLFSAFERIEEERNRTIEGTGLGMNITQRLLNLMGSELKVESIYGAGSYFWFEIEQKITNAEPIGDFAEAFRRSLKQHKEYQEKFTAPNAKILVVDDTVMNLTVVKGLLKQTKIKIDTAESGFKCLELITKFKYDIIFLDHRMPKMDGIETLQEMKKLSNNLNTETPIISLTANAISGAREQYIEAGFQDYLTKPINSIKLEELIIKYLPPEKVNEGGTSAKTPPTPKPAPAPAPVETPANPEPAPVVVEKESPKTEEFEGLPEWLNQVNGLNIKEGIEHCGDAESYLEALKVFANSIILSADEIGNYFNAGDWKNYTTKVHALKSSARVIGAMELSDRARRLEDAGNSGYFNEILHDTDQLLKLYLSYLEKLGPLLEFDDYEEDSDKPLISDDELNDAYEAIFTAAEDFDSDSMELVLQSLEEYSLPEEEIERYKSIKEAFSKFDWDKIKKLLEE